MLRTVGKARVGSHLFVVLCVTTLGVSQAFMPSSGFGVAEVFGTPHGRGFVGQLRPSTSQLRAGMGRAKVQAWGLPGVKASSEPPKPMSKYKLEATGSNLPKADSPKVEFPSLAPAEFRHPIDMRATRALQRLFPFESVIRQGMGTVVEQAMALDNMSSGVRVGPNQLPKIYGSLQEAKKILDLDIPVDLYVKQNPMPNAYTMAMQGKKPFIVVHSALIELMTPEELQAVIAHELGHLKCEHGVWITAANILTLFASNIPGIGDMVAQGMNSSIMRWLQAAELSCDRASLLVVQDPRVVVSVIMKLVGGSASFADEMNPDAYLKQAREFEEESKNTWIGRQFNSALATQLTHPLPVTRVRELDQWSRSPAYRSLLKKGKPIAALAAPEVA
mmetsp:Transcript_20599/g.32216  ORF Transcript_20599/g.32216 Transcript_20599/m.32216 type:complete len:390 (+) Transcript_20599:163-1332(+)